MLKRFNLNDKVRIVEASELTGLKGIIASQPYQDFNPNTTVDYIVILENQHNNQKAVMITSACLEHI